MLGLCAIGFFSGDAAGVAALAGWGCCGAGGGVGGDSLTGGLLGSSATLVVLVEIFSFNPPFKKNYFDFINKSFLFYCYATVKSSSFEFLFVNIS